jgi:hypothetical protein
MLCIIQSYIFHVFQVGNNIIVHIYCTFQFLTSAVVHKLLSPVQMYVIPKQIRTTSLELYTKYPYLFWHFNLVW